MAETLHGFSLRRPTNDEPVAVFAKVATILNPSNAKRMPSKPIGEYNELRYGPSPKSEYPLTGVPLRFDNHVVAEYLLGVLARNLAKLFRYRSPHRGLGGVLLGAEFGRFGFGRGG